MLKVTLEQAKLHLRVDGAEEDALITGLIAAAYGAIEGKTFRKVVEELSEEPDLKEVLPDGCINSAALLLIAHLYTNRGDTDEELPKAVLWLLEPYVDYARGA